MQDQTTLQPIDVRSAVTRWQSEGVKVLGLFNSESLFYNGIDHSHDDAIRALRDRVGDIIDAIQGWNEMDGPPGGSSAPMPADQYSRLIDRVATVFTQQRSLPILSGGVATGTNAIDTYLTKVDLSPISHVAFHQYDMRLKYPGLYAEPSWFWPAATWGNGEANYSLDLFRQFAQSLDKDVAITEWSCTNDALREEYVRRTLTYYLDQQVWNFYFAIQDGLMPRPFGLIRDDGVGKPAYDAYRIASAQGGNVPITPETLEFWKRLWQGWTPDAEYDENIHGFGIPKAWRDNYERWGPPLHKGEVKVVDPADGKVYNGIQFLHVGYVIWRPEGHKVLGRPKE